MDLNMNMVAVSPLGTIIEDLEQIEALLWEAFLSNNHILSSKDLHDLGTNAGNPDYGSIVSQAGAISRQYRPQIDRIQQALQSSNLSDNRAKELHTQLHQIGSERIEVIERFDRINQLSRGFPLIKNMQAAQNQTQSPLLRMEAARRVFNGYNLSDQSVVVDVLEQALLKRDSFQEQTDIPNAISDICALSDATRPAPMQETLGAMGERAAGAVASFVNALQEVHRLVSGVMHNNNPRQ